MTETPIDILSPKNDFVFKQLFGDAQHTAPLAALLQATLELPKIPKDSDGTTLWKWLKFISSETREEFESLAGKDTVMAEALLKLMDMSMDQPTRRAAEARAKWLWDEDARMRQSRREGIAEGEARGRKEEKAGFVRRLLQMNMPFAEIAKLADCPLSEIEELASGNRS